MMTMIPKTVWKFQVPLTDRFTLDMPREAKPLCLMTQHGNPQLWALVDPSLAVNARHFRLVGTGSQINDRIIGYIGSFQMTNGALVFHVFEVEP